MNAETSNGLLGSIVIPAHNEERVIGRLLDSLLDGLDPNEAEVVVVCNGCTDDTASRVRSQAPWARVVELSESSKAAALRAGERHVSAMPRLYVDADVVLPGVSARRVLEALGAGAVAARPPILYDTSQASSAVRSYYRTRSRLTSLHGHAWGAGVYGLSVEARSRFDEFPDVLADDLWVDNLLAKGEMTVVDTPPSAVRVPADAKSLLRVLGRVQRGKRDCPAPKNRATGTERVVTSDLIGTTWRKPGSMIDVGTYVVFAVLSRLAARVSVVRWARDDSSREAA